MAVVARGEAASAHAEFLAALGSGGDFDVDPAIEGGHGNFRAQHRLPRREFRLVNQVVAVHVKVGMFREPDAQVKVAGFAAAAAGFAAPGHAQLLALGDSGRNFDLMVSVLTWNGPMDGGR